MFIASRVARTTSVTAGSISAFAFPTHTFPLKSSCTPAYNSYKASMLEALAKLVGPATPVAKLTKPFAKTGAPLALRTYFLTADHINVYPTRSVKYTRDTVPNALG